MSLKEIFMCTAGAIILGQDDYILFKNKDFGKTEFKDHLIIDNQLFGASGVETFAEQDPTKEIFSGLSIGANSYGLFCCDSHVNYKPAGGANYDKLVEVALREGTDVPSAIGALQKHILINPSWAGNLVLTDGKQTARIEARACQLQVEIDERNIASTNHQFLFPSENPDASESSKERLVSAKQRISSINDFEQVFSMLTSHDSGDTGVCNHQEDRTTVYSYVLRYNKGQIKLYVTNAQPCQSPAYQALNVPIGECWNEQAVQIFIDSYPN
ncbi:MAG: hypothetical protein ACI9ES_003203 [Oceanospirillaceae bacterium]